MFGSRHERTSPNHGFEVYTGTDYTNVLALHDSACSHSWFSENLETKLNLKGLPNKLPVLGINSQQVVDTQIIELKLAHVHSSGPCSNFDVKSYVRKALDVENEVIDVVDYLKTLYPHLDGSAQKTVSYRDVEKILDKTRRVPFYPPARVF